MLKEIISASVVSAALLLSGCGSADSVGEDKLAAQHAIDSGDTATALSLLEPTVLKGLSVEEKADYIADLNDTAKEELFATMDDTTKITLASAYMQDADVSIMDIVSKLDTADGDTSFASLSEDIIDEDSDDNDTVKSEKLTTKVKNIDLAIAFYESMKDTVNVNAAPSFKATSADVNVSEIKEGVKLYLGMAYFTKATMLISYFGDLNTLEDDTLPVDPQFKATSRAIDCIYNSNCTDDSTDDGMIEISSVGLNATYSEFLPNGSRLRINIDGTDYDRFATGSTTDLQNLLVANYKRWTDETGSTTNSYIVKNFPFGSSYTFRDQVLSALNGAYTTIVEKAPEDVRDDIVEKMEEIDTNNDKSISMDELSAYIADN